MGLQSQRFCRAKTGSSGACYPRNTVVEEKQGLECVESVAGLGKTFQIFPLVCERHSMEAGNSLKKILESLVMSYDA